VNDAGVRLELAKLYEHFLRDHARALAVVEGGTGEGDAAVERRRIRLEAKQKKAVSRSSGARGAPLLIPGVSVDVPGKARG
jgi:hypothetical protein